MNSVISVKNVSKSFKNVKALSGLNLEVERGKLTAILGPNGAGKTTLIKILTTLLRPDTGEVKINGLDINHDSKNIRKIIGLAGQNVAVDENLTGWENLDLIGNLYHLSPLEIEIRRHELLEKFDLVEAASRRTKTYSGGMRRRLDLALSLIGKPQILFLDEPTTGLDPKARNTLWDIMNKLAEEGTTILLTTQYLEEADKLAKDIKVIDKGQVIAEGTPEELKSKIGGEHPTLDDVFLALTGHHTNEEI